LFADPGLLVNKVYSNYLRETQYVLGIVPHYVDLNNPVIESIQRRYPDDILLISPVDSPSNVIQKISSCANIVSSSLHGLIVADSLGVPNRWAVISDKIRGKEFKFRDYYSAFDVKKYPFSLDGTETLSNILGKSDISVGQIDDKVGKLDELCKQVFSQFT
jgi:pyruvyltransferase